MKVNIIYRQLSEIVYDTNKKALCGRGAPDFCIAEYFRIHEYFELSPHILDTILNSPPETRVAAQFIGENVEHIKRAIEALKFYPKYID